MCGNEVLLCFTFKDRIMGWGEHTSFTYVILFSFLKRKLAVEF